MSPVAIPFSTFYNSVAIWIEIPIAQNLSREVLASSKIGRAYPVLLATFLLHAKCCLASQSWSHSSSWHAEKLYNSAERQGDAVDRALDGDSGDLGFGPRCATGLLCHLVQVASPVLPSFSPISSGAGIVSHGGFVVLEFFKSNWFTFELKLAKRLYVLIWTLHKPLFRLCG